MDYPVIILPLAIESQIGSTNQGHTNLCWYRIIEDILNHR